jgi:hypothetical protein
MSTRAPSPTMLSVTDGRQTVGFILSRGPKGFEAFSADEKPLGLFTSAPEAANAITNAAGKGEG